MDNFEVKRNTTNPAAFKPIQIRISTYDLIKQMQTDTGVSIVDLMDAMVRFCAERLTVVDDE